MKSDFNVVLQVLLRQGVPERVPLYEHDIDNEVIEKIMGYSFEDSSGSFVRQELTREYWQKKISFYSEMGYDYLPVEIPPRFISRYETKAEDVATYSRGQRSWANEHGGPIHKLSDLDEQENWPAIENALEYDIFTTISEMLPKGMKIVGGACGGVFEHACWLTGFENLALAIHTNPIFVQRLFEKIGCTLVGIAEKLVTMECIGAYKLGDDLGYKTGTLLSPDDLRKYVFPWHKRIVYAAHKVGKPVVLHSCGQLTEVMDDLIGYVGIDAKHSFENAIMSIVEAKRRWGNRIAVLGGIDVDFLCRNSPLAIKDHTKMILKICAVDGGYALGSGNTITNYTPVENYLAMIEACQEFNGI